MSAHEESTLLSALIDGELSVDEAARLSSHLDGCPSCRVELDGLRRVKHRLSGSPRRAMPPELIAELTERYTRPTWSERLAPVLARPKVWMPAGAFATIMAAFGAWYVWQAQQPDQYVPLEPLLAAHSRYEAESLVPQGSLVASTYASSEYADAQDQDSAE